MEALQRGHPEMRNAARARGGVSPKLGSDRVHLLYPIPTVPATPGPILLKHLFRDGELGVRHG
jgi:hypothetical protein